MKKANSVKEMKELISEVMLPNYTFTTNFSNPKYLVDINYKIVIVATLIKKDDQMVYEFALDTQFINRDFVYYDELAMIKSIIDILEYNRDFTIKRFKKYTVESYEKEQEEQRIRSEAMLEAFSRALCKAHGLDYEKIKEEELDEEQH